MTEPTSQPSTNVIPFDEQLRKELAGLKDTLPPTSANKIKTKGKLFTLPNGQSHPGPMNAIVLDYVQANMFYPGVYNPKNPQQPTCWAIGKVIKELAPSPGAPDKKAVSCATCPNDKWGSAITGNGKACKNQYRLIVVPDNFSAESELLTLYVSPSGTKHWTKYVRYLADMYQMLPVQVVTEISFEPNETYPTLLFKFLKPHGELQVAMQLRHRAQELLFREPETQRDAA